MDSIKKEKNQERCLSLRRANTFLGKTLLDIVKMLQASVSSEATAAKAGVLQRCDPRFKLISCLIMLVAVVLTREIIVLLAFYSIILLAAIVSKVKLGFFLKRTLLFIPLFSLFIVLPAIFEAVTPGDIVVRLNFFTKEIGITRQGLLSAAILLTRIIDCVSLSVLLMLTTRHNVLLKTLRIFKLPSVFVMTLGMAHRYIYLLLEMVYNSFTAIKSRVGIVKSARTGRRIIGLHMGHLWLKSYKMQNQVYDAMVSRGYTGEPKTLDDFKSHPRDFFLLVFSIIILAGVICLNQFLN
ncbi:MAG: cobalt ECF transporter T component CbiQ [Spirochaetales bacterium]|nr:cobalt ECF transporter T component CbiQ [Spirochaetales bacterium]